MQRESVKGLLISRHWRDTPEGIELSFWVATRDGAVKVLVEQQEAVCFVAQEQSELLQLANRYKPLDLHTLDNHQPVSGAYFRQQRALMGFREKAQASGVRLYESDIEPADRHLMERFVRCAVEFGGRRDKNSNSPVLRADGVRPAQYTPDLKVLSLDIETDAENAGIISVNRRYRRPALTEGYHQ